MHIAILYYKKTQRSTQAKNKVLIQEGRRKSFHKQHLRRNSINESLVVSRKHLHRG